MASATVNQRHWIAAGAAMLITVVYFHFRSHPNVNESRLALFSIILVPYVSVVILAVAIAQRFASFFPPRNGLIGFVTNFAAMLGAEITAVFLAGQLFALALLDWGSLNLGFIWIGMFASASFFYTAGLAMLVTSTAAAVLLSCFHQHTEI